MNESKIYLKKHIESEKPSQVVPESLTRPMKEDLEFSRERGEINFDKNGMHFYFAYGRSDTDETLATVERMGSSEERKKFKDWRNLKQLIISDIDGNDIINLDSLLEQSADDSHLGKKKKTIVVFPATQEASGGLQASVSEDNRSIFLTSNITSPCTLLILLHEIGHYKRYIQNQKTDRHFNLTKYSEYSRTLDKKALTVGGSSGPGSEDDVWRLILEEERGAWAYALNQVRPLLRVGIFDRSDILKLVHEISLQSYSNLFTRFSSPRLKDKILKSIVSFINTSLNVSAIPDR